jgi:hypothetical protein
VRKFKPNFNWFYPVVRPNKTNRWYRYLPVYYYDGYQSSAVIAFNLLYCILWWNTGIELLEIIW